MRRIAAVAVALTCLAGPASAQPSAYDADGWVSDLHVVREAMTTRYANLCWAVEEREADLPAMVAAAETRLRTSTNDTEARRVFDRLAERLGDGHVHFRWPASVAAPSVARNQPRVSGPCGEIVRDYGVTGPLAARLPGWRPVTAADSPFPSGVLPVGDRTLGVVRIGVFSPDDRADLCAAAVRELAIAPEAPCDSPCIDRIRQRMTALHTRAFAEALRAVQAAGAQTLMIDLIGNGGGSEWAEVAARMVTPVRLRSARLSVIRHPHWVEQLRMRLADLDHALTVAPASERPRLQGLRDGLAAMQAEIGRPCDASPIWRGEPLPCSPTVAGPIYTTGVTDAADPRFADADWAGALFDPAITPFPAGVWTGPLIVAVDGDTASAAEQFAALLQDNRAAVLVGSPTLGAGCGFVNGGVPTPLPHSGGTLMLPDCSRLRADGANEVAGVQPDLLVGFRRFDGPNRRARLLARALPSAVSAAEALSPGRGSPAGPVRSRR